jgi:two-component system chemotaxis response regulator CheB
MSKKRVLIVDDSAVIRGMITRLISEDTEIEIVGSASNGQMAVQMYKRLKPDVTVMDIEMPVMTGIEALKEIIAFDKNAHVVMCSTLTQKNAEISIEAITLGATDYIAKPTSTSEIGGSEDFKSKLVSLVKHLPARKSARTQERSSTSSAGSRPSSVPHTYNKSDFKLRPEPLASWSPKILAIGSSTGGPQALFKTLKPLRDLPIPIVITQHMPASFTSILAQHITSQTGVTAIEGQDGMTIEAGKAYIAPGGKHMLFEKSQANDLIVKIDDGPMENFCKPAVDPMLRSLISIYGNKILCAILTGMGSDGLKGAQQLTTSGGFLYAQDAETSVVWGMPGAVATADICSGVIPIDDMGRKLRSIIK